MKSERMQEIVADLFSHLAETPTTSQQAFKDCPRDELIRYHHSLGQFIRNHYQLWQEPWDPELDAGGVDMSENHPDCVSMEIIRQLWDKVQNI